MNGSLASSRTNKPSYSSSKQGGLSYNRNNKRDDCNDNHQQLIVAHRTSPPSSSLDESGSNASRHPIGILRRLPSTVMAVPSLIISGEQRLNKEHYWRI